MTQETRHLAALVANGVRWGMTSDRTAATAPAREARLAQFRSAVIERATQDGVRLTDDEIEIRVVSLRSAYFRKLKLDAIERRRRELEAKPAIDPTLAALASQL